MFYGAHMPNCAGGLFYVTTPLYTAARDDLESAVAALLALPEETEQEQNGANSDSDEDRDRRRDRSQCSWAPAGTALPSGALMGYGGARDLCPPHPPAPVRQH